MVEFYVVAKCPMQGVYRNAKLVKKLSASYKDAEVQRFQSPEEIPQAQKFCEEKGVLVKKTIWRGLQNAVTPCEDPADTASVTIEPAGNKAVETVAMSPTKDDNKPAEKTVVNESREVNKPSALPVVRKNTMPAKQHQYPPMQLPQWASAVIFTDGSVCPREDGKEQTAGGYAALMVFRFMANTEIMVSGHKKNPKDSDHMEMMAIYKALKHLKKYKLKGKGKVALYSDCKNIVEAYNTKLSGWQDCGWKLRNGKHVKHWKLWRKIWKVSRKVPLQVLWVKGHANNRWNNRCDMTAKAEAKLRVG